MFPNWRSYICFFATRATATTPCIKAHAVVAVVVQPLWLACQYQAIQYFNYHDSPSHKICKESLKRLDQDLTLGD